MIKYLKLKENKNFTHIEIKINYKQDYKTYYLYVTPCKQENKTGYTTILYEAFSGVYQKLNTVTRKSTKAYDQAVDISKKYINNMIDYVCKENQIEVLEGEKICF